MRKRKTKPAIKVTLRLPSDLHESLCELVDASTRVTSLNALIVKLLDYGVDAERKRQRDEES